MARLPYQERVVTEKSELDSKIEKLTAFINGDKFGEVDPAEQDRLQRQLTTMQDYSDILDERIAAFPAEETSDAPDAAPAAAAEEAAPADAPPADA